ncbi:MAG TPA: HAD hydrolase-like protein [Pedobacter sp.]
MAWIGEIFKSIFRRRKRPKPDIDVLKHLMQENGLEPTDILLLGNESIDKEFAEAAEIDYLATQHFV